MPSMRRAGAEVEAPRGEGSAPAREAMVEKERARARQSKKLG